jgi:hypothetical protein
MLKAAHALEGKFFMEKQKLNRHLLIVVMLLYGGYEVEILAVAMNQ